MLTLLTLLGATDSSQHTSAKPTSSPSVGNHVAQIVKEDPVLDASGAVIGGKTVPFFHTEGFWSRKLYLHIVTHGNTLD